MSLEESLARLADGDRAEVECALARIYPIVARFCAALLPSRDAEDAAQAAICKIFERVAEYDRARPALPWLLVIAKYECLSARGRRARRREAELGEHVSADALSPEAAAMRSELLAGLQQLIGTLRPLDREAIEKLVAGVDEGIMQPSERKRRERAITRLRDAWRRTFG